MRRTLLLKKKQGGCAGMDRERHAASPRRALSGVNHGSHEETALAEFERQYVPLKTRVLLGRLAAHIAAVMNARPEANSELTRFGPEAEGRCNRFNVANRS
jgi:hypothetical protein